MPTPEPMYASIGTSMPTGRDWVFEEKYDGMRVIADATPRTARLVTRNGHDKRTQFPEIADAVRALSRRLRKRVVLDGEIVALVKGRPAPFQALQSRMQLKSAALIEEKVAESPAALVLFDVLAQGRAKMLRRPFSDRRAALERLLEKNDDPRLRISESSSGGTRMIAKARRRGWEGLIAKHITSLYVPGARSRDWLKLKLQHRAEFVVGGFTEPRRSRLGLGAVVLGYFDEAGALCYVGHMGGGFNQASLRDMLARLRPLERKTSPFADAIKANEPVHWVSPRVVVEVKFAEWTADGKLRQPIFLGVRDDKDAREVHKESESVQEWAQEIGMTRNDSAGGKTKSRTTRRRWASPTTTRRRSVKAPRGLAGSILRQLDEIEKSGGDGTLEFGRAKTLRVTSLGKRYFPEVEITKGDLMRYYAAVSPMLLPIIKDRPLVLKRYPDGIDGQSFFQQSAGNSVPDGVRTAGVHMAGGERAERIIGGDLLTLLYTVQIGTIAVHSWQARIQNTGYADTATIDLDPGDDVPFSVVITLAKQIKVELDNAMLIGAIKTSGSSGLHVVLPLPPKTAFEDAARLAMVIAERVTDAHPEHATLERSIKARPKGTIYVDAQQNAEGKSVVAAYSVRARSRATISAPLDWRELRSGLRIDAFTIDTMPARLRDVGDLWGAAMKRRNTHRTIERVLKQG